MTIQYLGGRRIQGMYAGSTFEDDFTGSDNWTEVGTPHIYVDTSADKLVVKMDRVNTNNKCVYDLGAGNVSDVDWILRYHKVNFSVVGASNALGYSGISSDGTGTSSTTSQDFIGLIWNDNGNANNYGTIYADGSAIPSLNNTGSYQITYTPSTGTDYWIEIKRSNDTMTITWFTDEFSTSVWSISQAVPSTVTGLRYLTFQNYSSNTSDTPIEFTVDTVVFYNTHTSFQVGSRFEETDTRNILIKDDVGWKDIYDKDLSNFRSESMYEQFTGENP